MHELSIVSSVLDQLDELQEKQGGAHISKVGLRIGELAGVDVDCLRFGFECVIKDTQWDSLALEIEWVARRQRCPRCCHEFGCADPGSGEGSRARCETPGRFEAAPFTACPQCGETATITIAGEELQIAYIEVETSEVEG